MSEENLQDAADFANKNKTGAPISRSKEQKKKNWPAGKKRNCKPKAPGFRGQRGKERNAPDKSVLKKRTPPRQSRQKVSGEKTD